MRETSWPRKILLTPFAVLYGLIISMRNALYDSRILKSVEFSIPVISVGNLNVGGTGKSPHIEFLIQNLTEYLNVATLSRGYKRKSQGFRFVEIGDSARISGDEPLQFKRKFPTITVAVGENRALAIPRLLQRHPETEVILLDDAFQHRAVSPNLNILLTEYNNLYNDDSLLPLGRLREFPSSYSRADIIVVTKCPNELTTSERQSISTSLNPLKNQRVYFSSLQYKNPYYIFDKDISLDIKGNHKVILLSAIANSLHLEEYLDEQTEVLNVLNFEDHRIFTGLDLENLLRNYTHLKQDNPVIITTEKDMMRLLDHSTFIQKHNLPIFALPIEVEFLDSSTEFLDDVKNFMLDFKV